MVRINKQSYYLAIASLLIAFLFNTRNFSFIQKINPGNTTQNTLSTIYGATIYSIDNVYYLSPVENFLSGKGWNQNYALGNGDAFRRVPGYSLVYLAFVKSLGYKNGHDAIKYFQLLLFALSVFCFHRTLNFLSNNNFVNLIISCIYGFTPIFYGWIFFTLTEGITPELLIFYFYFLTKAKHSDNKKNKLSNYLLASFFIGYLILTRPYTLLAGVALVLSVIDDYYTDDKKLLPFLKKSILIGTIPFLLIATWTVRNYVVTKEFVPLEKAFHPQTLDRMKPEYEGMLNFAKCWGEDGSDFNSYHQPMYFAAIKGDTASTYLTTILTAWPISIVNEFGRERLMKILIAHQQAIFSQKIYFDKQIPMPSSYLPQQIAVKEKYDALIGEYKQKHFFSYWFKSPQLYLKRMIFHSNTSQLAFFQNENRNHFWINLLRYLLLLLHISIYMLFFISLFVIKNSLQKYTYMLAPLLFILFFTIFHREIEQRYMLPILPIILLSSVFLLQKLRPTAKNL